MTAKVLGNRGPFAYGGASQGLGSTQYPDGSVGSVTVVGKAGDVAYLAASDIHQQTKVFNGFYFQATAGVSIYFTLANSSQAKNPDPNVQSVIPWTNVLALTTDAITSPNIVFTACKIVFTNAATVFIAAR